MEDKAGLIIKLSLFAAFTGFVLLMSHQGKPPVFQKGDCILRKSIATKCENKEAWEGECAPRDEDFNYIKQVGKQNYLTYFHYQGQWVPFTIHFVFADTYVKVSCPAWSTTP